ncbi:alkaline phosphatase family protein [Arthrobacter sp. MYb229]|uniref:alkaline phosphatase family protein n=1 Tax=unclassified Arthrobacter TaxID=235627 RepID=UPI000CFD9010|nr:MULTISPECIES: nucleotide pyrophosphatase/phosphodiesterase family protein [unclassified Arthrobacter]PRA06372.1 alkaline phosphatase family protein [Arthrobacter sp. MYb229]PRB53274.1 alkaline phosphatase family protein [Arthrobacter sp. MYb216]
MSQILSDPALPTPPQALPAAPAYGKTTLSEILPSAAHALGVPGYRNPLGLKATKRVSLIMVDGLGWNQFKSHAAHAPFLRSLFERAQKLGTGFPSTTATSLTSLATGVAPGEHGMLGYDVIDPERRRVVNQLGGWPADLKPESWQTVPTVFERVHEHGIHVASVSLPFFANSALTRAALRGPKFVAAKQITARARATQEVFASHRNALVYTYFNELDKVGHKFGVDSSQWRDTLEEIDYVIKSLVSRLPEETTVLITGDHGMVDVPESQRIDFSLEPELIEGVELTSGEPRGVHLTFAAKTSDAQRHQVREAWRRAYGSKAWVLSREEAIDLGYFGDISEAHAARMGDLIIMAAEAIAFYDGRRVAPMAFDMIGQHGSLTAGERFVPLFTHRTK